MNPSAPAGAAPPPAPTPAGSPPAPPPWMPAPPPPPPKRGTHRVLLWVAIAIGGSGLLAVAAGVALAFWLLGSGGGAKPDQVLGPDTSGALLVKLDPDEPAVAELLDVIAVEVSQADRQRKSADLPPWLRSLEGASGQKPDGANLALYLPREAVIALDETEHGLGTIWAFRFTGLIRLVKSLLVAAASGSTDPGEEPLRRHGEHDVLRMGEYDVGFVGNVAVLGEPHVVDAALDRIDEAEAGVAAASPLRARLDALPAEMLRGFVELPAPDLLDLLDGTWPGETGVPERLDREELPDSPASVTLTGGLRTSELFEARFVLEADDRTRPVLRQALYDLVERVAADAEAFGMRVRVDSSIHGVQLRAENLQGAVRQTMARMEEQNAEPPLPDYEP